ncbi:MAG: nuclear transport factor 2 family protein [Candidatus Korobacteraceae bacterium]
MKLSLTLAAILLFPAIVVGQAQIHSVSPSNADVAIRAVLQSQVEAWNHHDLDLFMNGYWHSPDLTFFSGTTETNGWEPTLERYRRSYQSEGHAMGTLSFSDLQVQSLGLESAFVRGKFQLIMPDGKQPHGVFTLVFRKFPEGWRIIHDHTCAE